MAYLPLKEYAVKLLTASIVAGAISFQLFGQSPTTDPLYSRAEVKRMVRVAQTANEFEHLADHFAQEASRYRSKSEAEEIELKRLLALPYHARSYSTQVESTRNRIDHYRGLSRKCAEQSAMYRERAKASGASDPTSVPPVN